MIASSLTVVVALLHFWFMVLESVLWTKPLGRKVFRLSVEKAEMTAPLASNQGAYNGMLAVGLLWSMYAQNPGAQGFLLIYVIAMGIYGAATVSPAILAVQSLPAALALGAFYAGL